MSEELSAPRRVLYLTIEGFSSAELAKLAQSSRGTDDVPEIFALTETNASLALEKIFAADTLGVWGNI